MDLTKPLLFVAGSVLIAAAACNQSDEAIAPPQPLQLAAPAAAPAPAPADAPAAPAAASMETPKPAPVVARVDDTATTKTKAPAPRRVVRPAKPVAAKAAPINAVAAPVAVAPSVAAASLDRTAPDVAAAPSDDTDETVRTLQHQIIDHPARPEAYESLAAIRQRQGEYREAGELLASALRNGGKARFTIMHDHVRGNFETDPKATCTGELMLSPKGVTFEGADGHRFSASWADVRDSGPNKFFGSGIGGFHVTITADKKYRNFNLAPKSRDKAEGKIILDLLAAKTREDRGK